MSISKLSLRAVASAASCALMLGALPAHAATKGAFRAAGTGSVLGPVFGSHPGSSLVLPDLVVNLAGIDSFDAQDAAINTVLSIDAAPGAAVDAISWNVSLSTVGLSWLSEATVLIVNSAGDGVVFSPGFGNDFSGSGTFADSASLAALGLSFNVLADGKLTFQFYEGYDDIPGGADAHYTAGNITLGGIGVAAVPEPASYGLMALGLLAVVGAARRRSPG